MLAAAEGRQLPAGRRGYPRPTAQRHVGLQCHRRGARMGPELPRVACTKRPTVALTRSQTLNRAARSRAQRATRLDGSRADQGWTLAAVAHDPAQSGRAPRPRRPDACGRPAASSTPTLQRGRGEAGKGRDGRGGRTIVR
eukprot:scaffold71486_cov30-Tisochrysis_lutea.AAC.7